MGSASYLFVWSQNARAHMLKIQQTCEFVNINEFVFF